MIESDKTKTLFCGSEVEKCTMCDIAPTCVDECGEFGNSLCPYFGKDKNKFNPQQVWEDAYGYRWYISKEKNELVAYRSRDKNHKFRENISRINTENWSLLKEYVCNCHSYNGDFGETPERILNPNRYFKWGSEVDEVCIDACIIEQIHHLWINGIWTLGSCCGHNGRYGNASVVIASGYSANKAKELLKSFDPYRIWDVLQWELVKK